VFIPGLDPSFRSRVDPSLYERDFSDVQGLSRLLLLERFTDPQERKRFKVIQAMRKLRVGAASAVEGA
jgi:hypothetical protein